MEENMQKKLNNLIVKWWFWLIIAIILIVFIAIVANSNNYNANMTTSVNTINSISNNTKNTTTKIEKTKVTVVDFSQMSKEEIQSWCNINKVKCSITENYSETIPKGAFVSQSINANSTMYEGDKVTVVYSLGKEPTMGEKNALSKAKSYLEYSSFSYKGLVEQLKYEGFSDAEATYGADNCNVDWNEQASKKAKSYIEYSSFSRKGLIEQLEYEGFTKAQAEYGVTAIGY